jgi:hypothetical protein
MSSYIDRITGGRARVTLIGDDSSGSAIELEIDLVDSFEGFLGIKDVSNNSSESDKKKPKVSYTENIEFDFPNISISCILSDNLLSLNDESISNIFTRKSAKDKLKQLIFWQRMRKVIILEGYTVGATSTGNAINILKRGFGNFESEYENFILGKTITDRIDNLLLGEISYKNNSSLGNDIAVSFNMIQAYSAQVMIDTSNMKEFKPVMKSKGQVNPQKAPDNPKAQSSAKKM